MQPRISRIAPLLAVIAGVLFGMLLQEPTRAAAGVEGAPGTAGCAGTAAQTAAQGGLQMLHTEDGTGRSRSYRLQVPRHYTATRRYPLVLVFHGSQTDSRQSYGWGLQDAPGAAENALFVFPDGIPYGRDGIGWDDTKTGYDMPLFDHILRDVGAAYCIDTSRVFVAGFSWGADFAVALACSRGDAIRAVAVNSADDEYQDKSNYLTYQNLPCPTHRHPAIRFGHAVGGDKEYPAPLFATTSKLLQHLNSCSATAQEIKSSTPQMTCMAYDGCTAEYQECSFDTRLGHALPPNWAADTWEFFAKF